MNGWGRLLIAPFLSAVITGGVMYVAVRTELATVTARQDMLHDDVLALKQEFQRYRDGRLVAWEKTLERLGAIEIRLKQLEERRR